MESLTEKFGTLGLQITNKNRCGAAKKRAKRTRLAKDPSGAKNDGEPRIALGGQPQASQEPGISRVKGKPAESKRPIPGPNKRQRSAGGTPEVGHVKRPKQVRQPRYARVGREGIRVAVVCEGYPESQLSKENFTNFQRAIGRLVDELTEEGFTPKLVDSHWAKGAAIMIRLGDSTKDWLAVRVPSLAAWEGSRLKLVGLDALPTYKSVVAWFPGSAEDAERYLMQLRILNQGLDTRHWRVYERKEESN